jgi:hypothetical protein
MHHPHLAMESPQYRIAAAELGASLPYFLGLAWSLAPF